MLKWGLHLAVVVIGVVAFVCSNINSQSLLEAAVYPLVTWVAIVYSIVLAVTTFFGWPGPGDRGATGSELGSPSASDGDSGSSGDGD
jgi:hypothetical protein